MLPPVVCGLLTGGCFGGVVQFETTPPPERVIQDTPQVLKDRVKAAIVEKGRQLVRERMASCTCWWMPMPTL